jgi:general secretion pathway protein D
MMFGRRHAVIRPARPAALCLVLLLAGCSSLQKEGEALIDQGNYGEGLAKLEQAMREQPNDPEPRIQYFRLREQVANRILNTAASESAAGQMETASELYRRVLGIDPNNARARAGLAAIDASRRHQLLAESARAKLSKNDVAGAELIVKAILAENPKHAQARELDQELRERERKEAMAMPALKSRLKKPVSLEFRDAPLKLVMEALSRSAEINFIMDREIRADLRLTVFVKNVRVEDAIDLILQNNQLEKKILTENTLLIYPNTPQKLREHQELVMRTFRIGNADPKQTLNLLRTMLKTKEIFVDERANLIVIRDTPDVIRAAERLIAAQDVADPEVVLELEILEVSRSKVRDLGITTPTQFSGPTGTVDNVRNLNSGTIATDTGFKLSLLRTDSDTKTLANPRVRVRNKDRARVHIGDRVPVISSTIVGTSATGSGGGNAVTTEQIQYLDVGIKIDVEPTIHSDDTVAVKINLDVSTLGPQTKTNAGTIAYQVGTRNATTVLRLGDGETQALMGLIRDDDVQTAAGLPFIGELPLLDRIFGTKKTDKRSTELVLLITPRLVRGVQPLDASRDEFWSGTEASLRMRMPYFQQVSEADATAAKTEAPTLLAAGPAAAAKTEAPALLATAPATALAPLAPMALSWRVPPNLKAGQDFVIELRASSGGALKSASVQLRYDPEQIEVLAVEDGDFFRQGGNTTVFTPRIDAGIGIVFATIGISGGVPVKGEAGLIAVRAKPLGAAATARLQFGSVVGVDSANRQVPIEGAVPLELTFEP